MRHGPSIYGQRADECVRLANLTMDEDIRRELLTLRQCYLRIAERLVAMAVRQDGEGNKTLASEPSAQTRDFH
ncbi:MAG TPA: hypothetical protein VNI35_05385 [Nitrospira sp.]|nr:hypothetical protein [Nitrospira sp.]